MNLFYSGDASNLENFILIVISNRRKHKKLWDAVETNEIKDVESILNKLGD